MHQKHCEGQQCDNDVVLFKKHGTSRRVVQVVLGHHRHCRNIRINYCALEEICTHLKMSARAGTLLSLSKRLQASLTHKAVGISGLKDISGFRDYHKNVRGRANNEHTIAPRATSDLGS